jgi:hypothetical protein
LVADQELWRHCPQMPKLSMTSPAQWFLELWSGGRDRSRIQLLCIWGEGLGHVTQQRIHQGEGQQR